MLDVEVARYESALSLCPDVMLKLDITTEFINFMDGRPSKEALEKKLDELSTRLEATFQ